MSQLTSITIYLPKPEKKRIYAAAKAQRETASQYGRRNLISQLNELATPRKPAPSSD